ncbi:hypothetical protein PV325_009349, partial [Microctonus aethiopoides]
NEQSMSSGSYRYAIKWGWNVQIHYGLPRPSYQIHTITTIDIQKSSRSGEATVRYFLHFWRAKSSGWHPFYEDKSTTRRKSRAHHAGIQRSPFQAMFGSDAKLGLYTTSLPKEVYLNIRSEEELEEIMEKNSLIAMHKKRAIEENSEIYEECTQTNNSVCDKCKGSLDNGICEICIKEARIIENKLNAKESLTARAKKNEMVIVDVDDEGLYKLGNSNGTIYTKFTRNQFTPCNAELVEITAVLGEIKSLRQLANMQSNNGDQGYMKFYKNKRSTSLASSLIPSSTTTSVRSIDLTLENNKSTSSSLCGIQVACVPNQVACVANPNSLCGSQAA